MASIIVLLIMAGCAAFQFLKGNFVRAFATFMAALCANIVAFGWSEQLAGLLIRHDMMPNWAKAVCFIALFVVVFAILQSLIMTITRPPIDFGATPERAGRIVFGLFLGFILSGSLLTAAALAPLGKSSPYQRFDPAQPILQKPSKPLLNPDGFITRLFSITSAGSLGGSKSFAVLHADFLNQLYLGRILADKNISPRTDPGSIELPAKAAAWPAPLDLKDGSGNAIPPKPDFELTMVRVGFTNRLMSAGGQFTPGQLRLLCKSKGEKEPFKGSAVSAYPVGYVKSPGRLQQKGLTDVIKLQQQDFLSGPKFIDFAFYVPAGLKPAALALKANDIVAVPQLVTADEAPKPLGFISTADCAVGFAKVTPLASAKIYGLELATGTRLLEGASLTVSGQEDFNNMQTPQSIQPAQFEQDKIICVRAELQKLPPDPNKPAQSQGENVLTSIFRPRSGYSLLSLKCNNPAIGSATRSDQLPSLIDFTGVAHRPCGVIATGKIDNTTTFEADYCSINLDLTDDGAVAKPFFDAVWLTEKAKSIFQFHVLYLVKTGTIIVSVQPAGAQAAAFDGTECFLVN